MNEDRMEQLFAELIETQRQALTLLTQAVAAQLNPNKLEADLLALLRAAEAVGATPSLLRSFVEHAAAAAKAESLVRQATKPAAGGRPN